MNKKSFFDRNFKFTKVTQVSLDKNTKRSWVIVNGTFEFHFKMFVHAKVFYAIKLTQLKLNINFNHHISLMTCSSK